VVKEKNKNIEPYLFLLPAVLLLIFFIFIPIAIVIKTSFMDFKLNSIERLFCGFDNYKALFQDNVFFVSLKNSFWWVVISLFFQVVFGMVLALCLNKKFKLRAVYQAIVLAPWAVSGFLIGLIWKWMFNGQYGLINDIMMRLHIINEPIAFLSQESTSLFSCIVANIWYGIPFFAIMILAALQGIPKELYEAADIDGANKIS
jgi:multiple sugar transport system permease protein